MNDEKNSKSIEHLLWKELSKKKPLMKPSYYKTYKNNTEHLTAWLAGTFLDEMTIEIWTDFFEFICERYSSSKASQYKTALNSVYNSAVIEGIAFEHVVKNIYIGERISQDIDFYSEKEIEQLLSGINGFDSEKALMQIILSTGISISELMAITECDVDITNKRLVIRKSLVLGKLVNSKKEREVFLDQLSVNAVKNLISIAKKNTLQECQIITNANEVGTVEYKFLAINSKTNQRYTSVDSFRYSFFKEHCELMNVRYIVPKKLHETAIVRLIKSGARLEWIVEQVGYTNVKSLTHRFQKWIDVSSKNLTMTSSHSEMKNKVAANDPSFEQSTDKKDKFSFISFFKSLIFWGDKAA